MTYQSTLIRAATGILYAAIFAISGLLTIGLWQSAASEFFTKELATATGAALHCALYLFAAAARGLPLEKPIKAATWAIVAALYLISVTATVAHLKTGTSGQTALANQAAIELDQANRITEIRLKNAETYAAYDYATKSMAALETAPTTNTKALAAAASTNAIATLPSWAQSALFLVLAILLDTTGIWSALLLFQPVPARNTSNTSIQNAQQPFKTELETLAAAIKAGELTNRPSVSKVQERLNIGRGKAHGMLEKLHAAGTIQKDSQGYLLP